MILYRAISILIGYLCGNVLIGYIIGKMHNVDLTKVGSGNVGTTNTLRNLGVKPGALTLIGDALKTIIGVLITWLIFRNFTADVHILMVYAGMGAILGHDFPFHMHFKGGKGIASSFGFILVLFPICLPICFFVFVLSVALTRYVSLGSILAAATFGIQVIVFSCLGFIGFEGTQLIEVQVICVFISLLAIVLHHANIDRLIHHKENKFSFHPETRK